MTLLHFFKGSQFQTLYLKKESCPHWKKKNIFIIVYILIKRISLIITSAVEVEQITTCHLWACRGQPQQSWFQTGSKVVLRERASSFSFVSSVVMNFPQTLQFYLRHLAAGLFLCNHLHIHIFLLVHFLTMIQQHSKCYNNTNRTHNAMLYYHSFSMQKLTIFGLHNWLVLISWMLLTFLISFFYHKQSITRA